MTSIRRRTATLVALSMSGLLLVGGVVLYVVLRGALTAQFDEALLLRAAALRSLTRFDGTKVEVDFTGDAMPRYADHANAEYFVVWVRDGSQWRVLEESDSLKAAGRSGWPTESLTEGPSGLEGRASDLERSGQVLGNVPLPEGAPGRVAFTRFVATRDSEDAPPGAVPVPAPEIRTLVAIPRAPLIRTLSLIGWCIAGVGAALALASIGASRWAVRCGLVPLSDLSRRVQALGPTSLATRFDLSDLPAELRPIAEQLSAMLARLEEAFEREKRFGAAASHELRTPIAELRSLLEVASSRRRSSEEWAGTAETALAVLARAQALCETLLRLSRAGAHRPRSAVSTVVSAVLPAQAARAATMHHVDPACMRVECPTGLAAQVDEAALVSIVGNLLDNALRYGRGSTDDPVTVRAGSRDGRVEVEVTNSAPELAEADLARLFEPFWRKDESRQDQRGFGLGLAVARTLARASNGELSAAFAAPGRVCFRLTLPAA